MCSTNEKSVPCEVRRYAATANSFIAEEKMISVESGFEVRLNGEFWRKVFCSPDDLEDLTVGLLAQSDKIQSIAEVSRLEIIDKLIEVETQAEDKLAPIKPAVDSVRFRAKDLLDCADELLGELSTAHAKTNGVHSGILFDGKTTILFREDIGRHNVFDKIFGAALRGNIFLGDKCLIFSGRCSAEMMSKLRRMKIPVVVAKSVPTTLSIKLAKQFGITLAGRLTADSFCIYTNAERIVLQ